MKTNLTTRMVSLILAIVLLVGVMPTAAFATEQEETTTPADTVETVPVDGEEDPVTEEVTEETELPSEEVTETTTEPVENEAENVTTPTGQDAVNAAIAAAESDVVNVTNGKTFTMQGKYLDLLHNHSEYGVQDYLISEWQDEIRIYFMEGDVSNITFKVWDSGSDSLANSFGVRASTNVWFMSYIYDKNTLTQIRSSRQLMPTTDMRIYNYSFAASFDIYKTSALDGNFKEFFYDASNTQPGVPDTTIPEDAVTVTNKRTFTIQGKYLKLLQSHNYYGTRDYIAGEWQDEIRFYFFEDISNVKFYVWDNGDDSIANSFCVRPSQNVWAIEYVYDKDTLIQKRSSRQMFSTSDVRAYNYSFVASFDIYWNEYFTDNNFFFDRSGLLPAIVPQNPPEDMWYLVNGVTSHATGTLLWLLQNHSDYGSKDYIAYEDDNEFCILFLQNTDNVKFRVQRGSYSKIVPSEDIAFTKYTYNKATLKPRPAIEKTVSSGDGIQCASFFIASFIIYADDSYSKEFFDPTQILSENPSSNPYTDVQTKTNNKTFTLPGTYTWLLVNQNEYGTKDYLAYEYEGFFVVAFFDDISGIKFSRCNYGPASVSFGITASTQVSFTEYTYYKDTFERRSIGTEVIGPDQPIVCSYNFKASFDVYMDNSYSQYFYMVNGEKLPTLPTKFVKEEWKEENGQKFHMDERYCNKIKECPEYKQGQRYLSYLWVNDFVIWFFDDPNVQFSVWDRSGNKLRNSFGVNPSVDTTFKAYVFDRQTLGLKSEAVNPLGKNSGYTLVYDFVSNIDIYTDESYLNYFYKSNDDAVKNTTDSRTFAISNIAYEKVQELIESERWGVDENYIAFVSDDEFKVWFFIDESMRVCVKESDTSTFKLKPASNTSVWEYVFDRTTMAQKETDVLVTFSKSDGYVFNNNFMANFNIYSDDTYSDYFYNADHSNVKFTRTFQPLKPKEAEEFLRFLTVPGIFVNIKKELPEYYNLLIGEIDDPKEELRTKVEFMIFSCYCISMQLSGWKAQINFGTNYLQNWLDDQDNLGDLMPSDPFDPQTLEDGEETGDEAKKKYEALIKNLYVASLERLNDLLLIRYHQDKLKPIIEDVTDSTELLELVEISDKLVNILGLMRAEKRMGNINYLNAHWNLLRAVENGDPTDIAIARGQYALVDSYRATWTNPEKMGRYAEYLFSIQRSVNNYPF